MARRKKKTEAAPDMVRMVNVGATRPMVIELRGVPATLDGGGAVALGAEWPSGQARTFDKKDAPAFGVHYRNGMASEDKTEPAEETPATENEEASEQ